MTENVQASEFGGQICTDFLSALAQFRRLRDVGTAIIGAEFSVAGHEGGHDA